MTTLTTILKAFLFNVKEVIDDTVEDESVDDVEDMAVDHVEVAVINVEKTTVLFITCLQDVNAKQKNNKK